MRSKLISQRGKCVEKDNRQWISGGHNTETLV